MAERAGGFGRSYRLHLPQEYHRDRQWPLVVVLHGAFSTARGIAKQTSFSELADREGFIIAYPNGMGIFSLVRHWNAGFCCGKAMKWEVDDTGFIFRVIDDVAQRASIDPSRVYLVGMSNGGMLAHRIAATKPERIAAVAVSAATFGAIPSGSDTAQTIPVPSRPMPIMIFHGLADENVPYEPQENDADQTELRLLPAQEAVAFWVDHNHCSSQPRRELMCSGEVERVEWAGCADASEVVLYTIDGWGHYWPGPHYTNQLPTGSPLREFDAGELMWRFFQRQQKRQETRPNRNQPSGAGSGRNAEETGYSF